MPATPDNHTSTALNAALRRILRPIVRLLVGRGLPVSHLAEVAKQVYVEVVSDEFPPPGGKKQTDSRISVLTGLTRKEVAKVRRALTQFGGIPDTSQARRYNRASRVTTAWIREPEYLSTTGAPRALSFDGPEPNFSSLVRSHSGDMPPRAVLDELLRVGAVHESDTGMIELANRGYVPDADEEQKFGILGTDVAALIKTVSHNISPGAAGPFFQRKVSYDNVSEAALPLLREAARDQGQDLLESLDREIAPHDTDTAAEPVGPGGKTVMVGVYYWEEDTEPEGITMTPTTTAEDKSSENEK